MSPLDQLIGRPETEEQLRKLVALFSEVKRVQRKDGGQSSSNRFFFFYSTDQGSVFPAASLNRLKQLSHSSTALSRISFSAFQIFFSTARRFIEMFQQQFAFSSQKRIFPHTPALLVHFPLSVWK